MQFSSSLKLNHIFRRLYRKGSSAANGYLVLYCRKNGSRQNRIGLTVHNLEKIMDGNLDEVIDALATREQTEKLQKLGG